MTESQLTSDQARAELYEIMRADISFEARADRALELGEDYLDVENAHLTRIDTRIDFWESIASTDPPDGEFPAGEVLDLQSTYCRRVIDQGSSIALSDASDQGWSDDPAFQEHGLHCYHGTPINIDGDVWGTLCFVSKAPRDEPFTEGDTLFAELMARLLEFELRTSRQQSEISLQSNLIGVLSRVLRHNLRNDLNVIRAHLTKLADNGGEKLLENDAAVNKIDKLIDLANTARTIESIAGSELDQQPVNLRALLENVNGRVRQNHPEASITLEGPDEIYIEAIPSLRTGLEELIENAAKHSGDSPEVIVSIDSTPDSVAVEVVDDGPGLPEQELEVLEEGTESPLIHGSGLGLWLSYWIIANHDGSIQAEVTDTGTRITVTLPSRSALSEWAESESLLDRFHREQDKFEAVFEGSFDAIVLLNDEGYYTDANESAAELFGLPREELLGRSIDDFVPKDFDVETAWTELMAGDRDRSTFTLRRPDGSERIVEYTAVTDIVPGQHLAILRDVSERIEREREVLETKERLEAIVDVSPDPIVVLDDRGVIDRWNDAAEDVFGYEASEVVGHPLTETGLYTASTEDAFAERFERAMNGERFDDLVVRRRTKEGDDLRMSISTAPLRDSAGDITGLVAVAQDLTDRVERERRIEALSESYPDLCFLLDEEGIYREIFSSPATEDVLIGDPDDLIGQRVTDVLPSEQGQLIQDYIEQTIRTGGPQTFHFELEVPVGQRVFEARTHPLSDEGGDKRLVSMVVRDITDLPSGDEVVRAT